MFHKYYNDDDEKKVCVLFMAIFCVCVDSTFYSYYIWMQLSYQTSAVAQKQDAVCVCVWRKETINKKMDRLIDRIHCIVCGRWSIWPIYRLFFSLFFHSLITFFRQKKLIHRQLEYRYIRINLNKQRAKKQWKKIIIWQV